MEITHCKTFDELDKVKFSELVESGFGRKLTPDYFNVTNPSQIYLAIQDTRYVGSIVIENIPGQDGILYLDKVVVAKDLQGNGIGKLLWNEMASSTPKAVWRAKKDNPIIEAYKKRSDAVIQVEGSKYLFFQFGLSEHELKTALEYAVAKIPTLEENVKLAMQR